MQQNPDWPAQAVLRTRREEAIALEPDDATVLAQCTPKPSLPAQLPPITAGRALLRCAEALANAGRTDEANQTARHAWVDAIDDAGTEAVFLNRWAGIADDRRPVGAIPAARLVATPPAATRQITRLDADAPSRPPRRASPCGATTRRRRRWSQPCRASLRDDPGLMLDRAKSLRRADRIGDALALWQKCRQPGAGRGAGPRAGVLGGAEPDRPPPAQGRQPGGRLCDRRRQHARRPASRGRTASSWPASSPCACCTIRRRLRRISRVWPTRRRAAITQGRAHYWLGRAAAAAGGRSEAGIHQGGGAG